MIAVSLILSVFGISFLCWLMFTLAVYALPFFAAMTVGLAAYHSAAGVIGSLVVGFTAGAVTLVAGQRAIAVVRLPALRGAIAILFAGSSAIAGFHATLALAQGVPSTNWREAFAIVGAMLVGGTAFVRMTGMVTSHQATWRYGPGSAADDGRDEAAIKQAGPSPSALGGIGVFRRFCQPTIERRGFEQL